MKLNNSFYLDDSLIFILLVISKRAKCFLVWDWWEYNFVFDSLLSIDQEVSLR